VSLASDIKTGVGGYSGLSTLISSRLTAGSQLPQGSILPAVSFFLVDSQETQAANRTRLATTSRVQFSCWASSYLNMLALAAQVEAAVNAFTTNTYGLDLAGSRDISTPEPETGLYHRAVDAIIVHTPAS
jgi:hypothetical protein